VKKSYIKLIKFSTILFVFGFIFFTYTNSVEAAVRTWTGASDDLWSNPGNWGGAVPVTGDDLVFPGGADNLSNENDLTENTIFNSITFSDDGYTLSGNTIILGPGLAGITDISSSGGNTIALNIQLNATRDIFVTNVNESLTISGRITGIGGITKEGLGKLILSGGNTYGGVTKINVGVVSAQHDRALGTIALGTEVVGNASLELQGGINISYEALALRGWGVDGAGALRNISGNNTYGGLITMIAGGAKIVSDSDTLTLTGGTSGSIPIVFDGAGNITFSKTPISGSATVTKNGAGTLTYNFPNTYTGLTTINAGTLLYGVDNAILTSAITVTGGTLDIATYSDIVGVVTLGTLDLASGTITGSTGVLSSTGFTVYNGIISAIIAGNAAALTKSTPGIVTLTRPNQFTGTTTVSAGILKIQDSLALGVIDGITTVSAGATLQIDGDGLSIPEYITFSGTGHLYNGAIQNINGDNTLTGLLTMAAAGTLDSEVGTTLTIDSRGISATTLGLTFNADGDFVFTSTAPIYGTTAALVKNGEGSVILGAFNNFTGATNINSGSIILSGSGAITRSVTMTINTGGRLVVDNENGGTDRLADTLAVTMNGGSIDFYGSSVGDVFATSGALTISSGQNIINVHPSSGGATVLRFASLTRAASASALFRGVDFGDTPGAGVSTLLFTTSPALVGDDGAPGTPTLSILQGVFGDNSMSGNGADMVTYARGGIGVRLLNRAGFSNEYTNDLTITNANVKLTASTPAFTSMINSLILDSSAEITNPDNSEVITLTSGNIVNLVTDTNIGGANTTLAAGSIDFSLRTIENLTISANLTTTGGITKSGSNTLTFSTPQSYTGTTDINRGTLKYGVDNVISNGAVNINSGTLDIDQYDDTVGVVTLNDGIITGTTGVLTGTSYSVRDGTISAIIGGSGTLTKVTTATSVRSTVLLTRDNTYTGVTAISGGILKIGSAGDGTNTPLGTTAGGTTIANVGALDLNGFTLSTDETITSMGSLGFGAGSSVANGNSNMGALMNSSPTSVTYSGDIVLAATSRINADYGAVTISGNISGNQLLTLGGYSDITFSGVKSGTSGITKDGIGTLTLSGNNSYSGATTISVGTVKLGATGSGANTPLGTTAGITTVALGARLDLNGYTLSTAQALTLNGVGYGLGDFASGALMNSSGSSVTYSGLLTLGSTGPLIRADFGDINLTAAGTITGAAFALTLGGSSNGTLASVIGTTTGTVTKIGTGMWTLSGNSTYTGATTINMGTLRLGGAGSGLNTPLGVVAGGTTITNGSVLDLNGYTLATAETLAINGRGINDSGALINNSAGAVTYSGAVAQGSDSRITNSGAGLLTFTGALTGAFALYTGGAGNITHSTGVIGIGTGTLTKQGAGTLTVNSSATYTGITRISDGTLAYGASGLLAATPVVVDGGTWNMGGITDTVGTVTLVGGTITNGTLTATTSYTMESGTVSAILAGAVAFTKNTNNTVTLTGANTNSSTTTINAGNLTLSGSGSAVSSTMTVNLGGTLTLDNSTTAVASRLGDALALTLNGGNFNFIGNSAGASSETAGALTLPTGHNTITVTPGTGGSTTMTFASLSRTAGATALFRGTDMRSAAGANVSTLLFTAAPALTGAAGAEGTTTMSVLKGAFGDTSLSGTGSDMVTVISNKLSPLASGEYTGDLQTANANVKLTADRAAVAINTNSLILNGFGITNPGGAVTIPISSASLSGNILINSVTNIAGANTTLGITTTELPILATANSTISATIGTAAAGSVTLSGTGNVTLSATNPYTSTTFINGATLTAGANNVISSGGVTMRGGVYNLNGNSDTVGAISLTGSAITTGAGTLTGNGSFTTATNANYASTISGNLGLGANATFTINDGLMDNDAVIYATISGGFTFAKAGTGVLILAGSNTYTGATTVSAGTLRLGAPGGATNTPLGTTAGGTTVTGASSVLDLNGHTLGTTEALTLSGALAAGALQNTSSTDVSYNGQIILGAASTIIANYGDININATGNITGNTFSLTIGGAGNGSLASNLNTTTGTLVKNGLGTWIVSGTSSFTGVTTVSAGTFKLGSAGTGTNTPLGTSAGGVSITSGAIFDLNGFTLGTSETATINGTGIASTGAFINSSNNAISYTGATVLGAASRIANYGTGLFTLSGNMSGNFARTMVAVGDIIQSAGVWSGNGNATLVKEGSGTLTLSGQNTTTGAITISTGILKLGASGGATNTPLGTNAGGVVVSSGAVLDLSTYSLGGASTYETLNLSGTGLKNNGVLISEASGNNNFGAMTLSANSTVVNSGSGIINFRGTVTAANSRNFDIGGTGPVIISGVYGATATTATITKRDSGSLTISAASITTGLVRINGGTLTYGVNDALAAPAITIAGGTLDLAGFNETNIGAVTLIDGSIENSGGAATLTSTTTYTTEKGTISAVLGGAAIAFNKNTAGTVTLAAANAFTGATNINAGTLAWGVNDALSSGNLIVTGGVADLGTRTDTVGTVTLTNGAIVSSTGVLTGTSYAVASGTISAILAGCREL
jgi:fibronectin-binding autotransporter adhesin